MQHTTKAALALALASLLGAAPLASASERSDPASQTETRTYSPDESRSDDTRDADADPLMRTSNEPAPGGFRAPENKGESSEPGAASGRRDDDTATSSDDKGDPSLTGEQHRSAVATFVHSLLEVADRDGGIGEQVREIAREQERAASSTAEAIDRVESRSSWKSFILGSDYTNLGELRSRIASSTTERTALEALRDKARSASDKAALDEQIKALDETKTKLERFVDEHENRFSLLGWLVKWFAR